MHTPTFRRSWEVRRRKAWLRMRRQRGLLLGGSLLDYLSFALPVAWLLWVLHTQLLSPSLGGGSGTDAR